MEKSKQGTKQQIVDAAFKLFSEKGYNETSVSQIARAAGLSKGLMYHYFDSKEALLIAILEGMDALSPEKKDWQDTINPFQSLKTLVDLALEYLQKQPALARFSLFLTLHHPESTELEEKIGAIKQQWKDAFREAFRVLGYLQPPQEALYLIALLDGMALNHLGTKDYPLEELKKMIYRNYGLISPGSS